MTVLDASVMVDALVYRADGPLRLVKGISGAPEVPAIFSAEVTAGIRGLLLRMSIHGDVADDARQLLAETRLHLHPFEPYAERIWELRENLTIYDAWYVAIAERLDEPLVTSDGGILNAPGLRCELIDAR